MDEKILVIANARKLYGKKKLLLNTVIAGLNALGHQLEIYPVVSDAESEILLPQLSFEKKIKRLVVAGGDGFINLILKNWPRQDIAIAFIPLGTCNIFARECGYTKNASDIVIAIHNGCTKNFYCGIAKNFPFVVTAGCGLDSVLVNLINRKWKKYLGRVYLFFLVFKTIIKNRPTLQVRIDNQPSIEVSTIIIAKSPYYAGHFCIAPHASIFDPTLYAIFYKKKSMWHELKLIIALFRNQFYNTNGISIVRAQYVHITNPESQPIQLDGDIRMMTPAEFSLDNKLRQVCIANTFPTASIITQKMNHLYQRQVNFYDLFRRYYLCGRDVMLNTLDLGNENVCEIGCGTARNLIFMANRYPHATFIGVDAASVMIKYACKKVVQAHLQHRITLCVEQAKNINAWTLLPNHAMGFDRIIFSYTLSMIPDCKAVLETAIKNIKPGGLLHIVDFSDHQGFNSIIKKFHMWWLSLFGVYYRYEVFNYLQKQAALGMGTCQIQYSPKHYYEIIIFQKAKI